jgi:hypothetical protein
MAGATLTQLLVKVRLGRAHYDRNPNLTHDRRAGDWLQSSGGFIADRATNKKNDAIRW